MIKNMIYDAMPLVLIKHCVETQAQKLVSYVFFYAVHRFPFGFMYS